MATQRGVAQTAPEPPAPRKRLVLVVHGIGHEPAGETVRRFAGAIAATRPERRLGANRQILYLAPERAAAEQDTPQMQVFPCHVETLEGDHGETVLAEVHWEDLSRIKPTLPGAIRGLFKLIFGLRHLARLAAEPGPPGASFFSYQPQLNPNSRLLRRSAARAVQSLSRFISYLLRGPAAAAAFLWHLGWLAGIAVLTLFVDLDTPDPSLAPWMPILTGSIGILIGAAGHRFARGGSARLFFRWLGWSGLILAVLTFLMWKSGLLQLGTRLAADVFPVEEATGFTSMLVLGWLLSIAPMILAGLCMVPMGFAWLTARCLALKAYRPGLGLAFWSSGFAISLMILVMTFALVLGWSKYPEHELRHELKPWIVELVPRMFFLGLLWLLLGAAVFIVWWRRQRWKDRGRNCSPKTPCPRLLLAPEIRLATSLHFGAFFFLWWQPLTVLNARTEMLANVTIAAVVLAVTVGLSLASGALRSYLDLCLDVITHFRPREPSGKPVAEPNGPEPRRTTAQRFPYREQIQERFRTVWRALVTREHPSHVTVVAHSQGTMVALEALADKGACRWMQSIQRCDLVTMGSPFHHLYQEYFANEYPPLEDLERWGELKERLSSWTNIFRSDDFVGTEIEARERFAPRPANLPVGLGGHAGYWTDRRVVETLTDRGLV